METQHELSRPQVAALTEKVEEDVITVAPLVDIYENKDEFLVIADFPGVPKESLVIRLDGPDLTIEGTQQAETHPSLPRLSFSRAFRVPNVVDADRVHAELDTGVLRVHLPKSEACKPRQIAIR